MALVKEIKTEKDLVASYHKISRFSFYQLSEGLYEAHVSVRSYVNEEARRKSVDYEIDENTYVVIVNLIELETTPVLKLLYNKLKEKDEFKSAVNA